MTYQPLIANLVNASRAAGWARGKSLDDTADNRAEDAALDAIKAEIERLRATLKLESKYRQGAVAENDRLRTGIDQIIGMCLSTVGIGKIHATAVALLGDEQKPSPVTWSCGWNEATQRCLRYACYNPGPCDGYRS